MTSINLSTGISSSVSGLELLKQYKQFELHLCVTSRLNPFTNFIAIFYLPHSFNCFIFTALIPYFSDCKLSDLNFIQIIIPKVNIRNLSNTGIAKIKD